MAEETMLGVGATVEVKDDAIAFDVESSDNDSIAGGSGLSLLIDHLAILFAARRELAICLQREYADRQGTMGETLLRLKIANKFAASSLIQFLVGELETRGVKGGRDIRGRGLLSYNKDLCVERLSREKETPCEESPSVRAGRHGSTSDTDKIAPSVPF
jgi:hypothetical protein